MCAKRSCTITNFVYCWRTVPPVSIRLLLLPSVSMCGRKGTICQPGASSMYDFNIAMCACKHQRSQKKMHTYETTKTKLQLTNEIQSARWTSSCKWIILWNTMALVFLIENSRRKKKQKSVGNQWFLPHGIFSTKHSILILSWTNVASLLWPTAVSSYTPVLNVNKMEWQKEMDIEIFTIHLIRFRFITTARFLPMFQGFGCIPEGR